MRWAWPLETWSFLGRRSRRGALLEEAQMTHQQISVRSEDYVPQKGGHNDVCDRSQGLGGVSGKVSSSQGTGAN